MWKTTPVSAAIALSLATTTPVAAANFTTAAEVKPILAATEGSWIALRDWDGQELLYFTHLEAWRCGLSEIRYAINDGKLQKWDVEPCYEDTNSPNAIKAEGRVPYAVFTAGEVQKVSVQVVYDDDTRASVTFTRDQIMMN